MWQLGQPKAATQTQQGAAARLRNSEPRCIVGNWDLHPLHLQDTAVFYKKFSLMSKFLTVIRDLFFCSRCLTEDNRTLLLQWWVSTGCRLGVDLVSTQRGLSLPCY